MLGTTAFVLSVGYLVYENLSYVHKKKTEHELPDRRRIAIVTSSTKNNEAKNRLDEEEN